MRKSVMISSFVSFLFLSGGLIMRVLTDPMNLVSLPWPWFLSSLLIAAGITALFAVLILYIIYWYRQERAQNQQFTQWGMRVPSYYDLLRRKEEKVRPYQREVWLQLVVFISLGLIMLSGPVTGLILPQVLPPPSGPYTPEQYIKWQNYEETFPQIEATYHLIFLPGIPLSIFIATFLSQDLAKNRDRGVRPSRKKAAVIPPPHPDRSTDASSSAMDSANRRRFRKGG